MTGEPLHPLVVDGVRHESNCKLFQYWNGKDDPEKCSCGAENRLRALKELARLSEELGLYSVTTDQQDATP